MIVHAKSSYVAFAWDFASKACIFSELGNVYMVTLVHQANATGLKQFLKNIML